MKGRTWPTSEHYFQAQKFAGTPHEEEIRLAKSPMIAARMGRSRKRPLRKEWEAVKDDVMLEALCAFSGGVFSGFWKYLLPPAPVVSIKSTRFGPAKRSLTGLRDVV